MGGTIAPQFTVEDAPKASDFAIEDAPQKSTIGHIMNSAGDFMGELWKQINPISGLKGAAQLAAHPIDTYMADINQRHDIYKQAEESFKSGNYTEGAARLMHAFIPFLGPQMNEAANNFEAGNYAKGAGQSVGLGLNVAGPAAVARGVTATLPSGVRDFLANRSKALYQSALKPSLRVNAPNPADLATTGLENKIPVSAEGVDKISGLISELNNSIKSEIASNPNAPINKFKVASRLSDTANRFTNQVNPEADLNNISAAGNEFLRNQPTDIAAATAQKLKTGTYQQLGDRAYGELATSTVEAQKALARGLKEELVKQFPEIARLNAKESQLIDLDGAMETAVRRIGNHQLFGIGTPLAAAGAKAVSGSTGAAAVTGTLKAILDNPVIKSKLAISLNQASKGAINLSSAMGRVEGYANSLGNAQQQEQSGTTTPAFAH